MEITMKKSVMNIFKQSDESSNSFLEPNTGSSPAQLHLEVQSSLLEKQATNAVSDYEYERSIIHYISQKKRKMILRLIHNTLVDIFCSISSILTLLSLLLMSFNTGGLINLFYVIFCLTFIYQMKNFIFQKRWNFPFYLRRLLKPFVYFEICIQILYQIPIRELHYNEDSPTGWQSIFGIFRLWVFEDRIISTEYQAELIIKSLMLVLIIMQENIFRSIDYKSYLLRKLSKIRVMAPTKAYCLTYMYNNRKIKDVIKIQFEKKNMIKKLAIVRKQLALWNESFNKVKEESDSRKVKRKLTNPDSSGDEGTYRERDTSFKGQLVKRNNTSYQMDFASVKEQPKLASHYSIERFSKPITEFDPKERRRGAKLDNSQEIEAATKRKSNNIQAFLEKKMLEEELLLRELSMDKLTFPLKLVLWVRANLSNEVLVKIDYSILEDVKWRLESGSIAIRTKIEGALLKDHERKKEHDELVGSNASDNHYKEDLFINHYKKMHTIIYEYMKLASKILVSNTAIFCYIFMILAHIYNGSLLSAVYPLSIFIYALLEETRPRKWYWLFIILYTCSVLFTKYIFQTYPLRFWISEGFNNGLRSARLGIYVRDHTEKTFLSFYLWEILVLMFTTIHVLFEISIGLWDTRETELENVESTVSRLYASQKRDEKDLQYRLRSFLSDHIEEIDLRENLIMFESSMNTRRYSLDHVNIQEDEVNLAPKLLRFCRPTNKVQRSSVYTHGKTFEELEERDNFEVEMAGKKRNRLYSQGKKISLKDTYSAILRIYDDKGYLLPPQTLSEYAYEPPTIEECEEFVDRVKTSKSKIRRVVNSLKRLFTSNSYFQTLFPQLKEQKPGKDLYTWIALIQFLILVFLIPFFTRMEKAYTSDSTDDFTTNQFSGTMVIAVFIQIGIIICDRFLYLSRKFIKIDKREIKNEEEKIAEEAFNRAKSFSTLNRVNSFSLNASFVATYLEKKKKREASIKKKSSPYEENYVIEEVEEEQEDPDSLHEIKLERNNSHRSIMLKYYFQLILVIFIHYMVFWHFPNRGNLQIQNHGF